MTISAVLFWIRSFELFSLHEEVGPLLISVKKMMADIQNFSLLMAVFLGGFFFAFSFVVVGGTAVGEEPVEGFQSTSNMLLTLYDAILGGVEFDAFESLDPTRKVLAEILSVAFLLIASITLLNLLIAMMGSTYDDVKEKSDEEYRFALATVRWKYDQRPRDLPSPLNLLVAPVMLVYSASTSRFLRPLCAPCLEKCLPPDGQLHCAYCHRVWDTEPFNINRPKSGRRCVVRCACPLDQIFSVFSGTVDI